MLTITKEWYAMVATRVEEMVAENIRRLGDNPLTLAYELYRYSEEMPELAAWEKEVLQAFCDQLHSRRPPLAPSSIELIGRLTGVGEFLPRGSPPALSVSTTAPVVAPATGGHS